MDKIPVIINNRDLLTWPKAMVEKIKTYDNVGYIIIFDKGSTYPCHVYMEPNRGHTGAWDSGIVDNLGTNIYVITDSDLGLEKTPKDTLTFLYNNLIKHKINKIGLGLDWKITPSNSPYYSHIINYEKARWYSTRKEGNIYFDIAIDTTFALYNVNYYFIGGASVGLPYLAKHYPWYLTEKERNNNEEFMYYIKHASASSSYKTFLNL
jgi:hypothetical protein